MCVLDMETAESDGQDITEAILFNGTNPHDENENLLIKYFPKTGKKNKLENSMQAKTTQWFI